MEHLLSLQRRIEARADPDVDVSFVDRLCVTNVGDQTLLDFYGDPSGETFEDLLDALSDPQVANSMASLDLRGPDEGANGTRNWDLTPIVETRTSFPKLRSLSIEQTKPTDHNVSIVARTYEEEGVLARILAKAPQLEVLIVPSAPNVDFFRIGEHPIQYLNIDTGYDHQGFIANLARSSCFPRLRSLAFGEYNETYMDDFSARITPFADYRELFTSAAFTSVKVFEWTNPVCSPVEIAEIKNLKQNRQVKIVRWSSEWLA